MSLNTVSTYPIEFSHFYQFVSAVFSATVSPSGFKPPSIPKISKEQKPLSISFILGDSREEADLKFVLNSTSLI